MPIFSSLRKALLATAGLTIAVGAQAAGTVHIYNWSDYIGPTTLADFEKKTGISVDMTRKSSGETYAQVRAEAAEAVRLGLVNYGEHMPVATAEQNAQIRLAGLREGVPFRFDRIRRTAEQGPALRIEEDAAFPIRTDAKSDAVVGDATAVPVAVPQVGVHGGVAGFRARAELPGERIVAAGVGALREGMAVRPLESR